MMRLMLDTMIFDKLSDSKELVETIQVLVQSEQIRIISTHIQRDEVLRIKDVTRREKILSLPVEDVPTSVFVIGVSRLGQARLADDEAAARYERIAGAKRKHSHDAIIALTAEREVDVIVTEDRRLRNRIAAEGSAAQVWDFARFESFLHAA